jgi:hypothetical protein
VRESPVILLVNVPDPEPLTVFEFAIVGFWDVLQHTPLELTAEAQVPVTLPPDTAPEEVMPLIVVVEIAGSAVPVVNDS